MMQKVEIPRLPKKKEKTRARVPVGPTEYPEKARLWKFSFGTQFAHAMVFLLP